MTNNTVYMIDCATNTVTSTIGVGQTPVSAVWDSVENRTYVANRNSSSISVLEDRLGIEEERSRAVRSPPLATIIRGVLELPLTAYRPPLTASLLDLTGRKVLKLHPGANDVSRLAPGVYFVWSATTPSLPATSETLHSTYKVILTK
jgi:YVTN family beta-propeller protein